MFRKVDSKCGDGSGFSSLGDVVVEVRVTEDSVSDSESDEIVDVVPAASFSAVVNWPLLSLGGS